VVRTSIICVCALVLWGLANDARGDGAMRDALGARSAGRGGANLAFADNGAVLHDNPGALTAVAGEGLVDVNFDLLVTDLEYADADNPHVDASDNPFPLAQTTIIRHAPGGWSYGVGVYSTAGFCATYDMQGPAAFPGRQRYKSIGTLARILPAVAYQVTDWLSVGASLGVAASHMELEGPYYLQSPGPWRGAPTLLDLQATGASPTGAVGLQVLLTPTTTVGLAYYEETRMRLDGTARVTVPGLGQSAFDADFRMAWPRSLGLGVRQEVGLQGVLSADVYWYNWSRAFDNFRVNLSDASNPVFAQVLGPQIQETMPLAWRDTVSVRVGYEHFLTERQVVRAGYIYHRNPIPDGTLAPFIQTTLEHSPSIGYGWQNECYAIDLAYQYSFDRPRDVASSDFVGGDFDQARHHTTAHWFFFSFLRRF